MQAVEAHATGRLGEFGGDVEVAAEGIARHDERRRERGRTGAELRRDAGDTAQFHGVIEHAIQFCLVEADAVDHVRGLSARIVPVEQ